MFIHHENLLTRARSSAWLDFVVLVAIYRYEADFEAEPQATRLGDAGAAHNRAIFRPPLRPAAFQAMRFESFLT